MLKAIDVANFFIETSKSFEEGFITNLRLNKLLYFAQGWSLARLGKPLFEENIEAWQYGPVVRSVYFTFKVCGSTPIFDTIGEYDEKKFTLEELDLLTDVAVYYAQYSTAKLVNMTHRDGSPWVKVISSGANIIEQESIKDFFKTDPALVKSKEDIPFIGYHNEQGHLILPKEWDEDYAS